ncbi:MULTISPECIES: hypothetical protein [Clostridium]|uniref:DUF3784 domain-containing protein n=1 Tax=Clostridium lapidicellarium TaxID=3240931 RepID=A0ABV4DSE4_9CLOT|nr:hypothetical protein [uncultured Clostridium sp.]
MSIENVVTIMLFGAYNSIEQFLRYNDVKKRGLRRRTKKKIGLVALSIGVGFLMTVIIPIWGWIIAAGAGLIYCGWYLIEHHK